MRKLMTIFIGELQNQIKQLYDLVDKEVAPRNTIFNSNFFYLSHNFTDFSK